MAQVEKLDYQSDLEDALLTLAPDGPLDPGGVTWTGVNNADNSDLGAAIEADPAGDHTRAIVRLPVDVGTFDFTVTATASVDKADTTEVETISSTFHIAGAHSKATELGGTATAISKGSGLP